ncbi:putative 6-phosphogluconolactonase, YbhE-type [Acidobacteriia bacterium SbA2]|nr:putative 6-phosphogluconolactonase, YbhE-type [Acidobacteriia bacterium SbA2]
MRFHRSMKTNPRLALILTALIAPLLTTLCARGADPGAVPNKYLVYIGTYTEKGSKGIYACRFDAAKDHLDSMGLAAETADPSFLTIDPSRKHLYAVNEVSEYQGRSSGGVSAFAIAPGTGKLTFLNEVASGGAGPCHLTVDNTGKYVLVANYGGGSLAVFPIQSDGSLGKATAFVQHKGASVNPQRQEGPHVHSVYMSPDNRFVISADLGLDEVFVYRFDAGKGTLTPNIPPSATVSSGAGPRHFAFTPNAKFGYVIDELQSTVTPFSFEAAKGALDVLQPVSTLPEDFKGDSTAAEVTVHPSGKFLYASNRGLDTIAVFSINSKKGTLMLLAEVPTLGKTPRGFSIDPTGRYLFVANQDSDNVVQFRINPTTGLLSPTGQVLQAPSPVCVTFLPLE